MPFRFVSRRLLIVYRELPKDNFSKPYFANGKLGFTLVELLVVLGLLSVTVVATLLFLTSTLKGSNQATVVSEVKQNGQVVLDLLEREIRGANDAQKISNEHIKLVRTDGLPLHVKCFHDKETHDTKFTNGVNGWIGTAVSEENDPAEIEYTPITSGGAVSISMPAAQRNSYLISGMDINNCEFDVQAASSGGLSPPVVSLKFIVNQAVRAPSRPSFEANAKFQTTISLRRLN